MAEYFNTFNKNNITITSNKKRITQSGYVHSIYGCLMIDNDFNNKTVTKWLFKIHSLYYSDSICIGIDSSNEKYIDGEFSDNINGSIGYHSNGDVYKDNKKIEYGDEFNADDIITMIHNPISRTITFTKQYGSDKTRKEKTWYGGSKKIIEIKKGTINTYKAIKMNNDNKKYKMCVYLKGSGSSVELLSCDQYIGDNQQNDNNEDNTVSFYISFYCIFAS